MSARSAAEVVFVRPIKLKVVKFKCSFTVLGIA